MMPNSAHSSHFQDLQHQVTVKTLTLQTLQREYEALLQKLERMRVRTQVLEKKFEVSDAEINSLSDEKEKLANQVQKLEAQVEELQQARDEARKAGAETAAQYMQIVEMAGRLQGPGVSSQRSWEQERELMLARIKELEGSRNQAYTDDRGTTGEPNTSSGVQSQPSPSAGRFGREGYVTASPWQSHPQPADEISTLRAELQALMERNKILENTVRGIVASANSALGQS
jgi:chromosome segregation ATPase